MATGAEHYTLAEQALATSRKAGIPPEAAGMWLQAARVHGRLAEIGAQVEIAAGLDATGLARWMQAFGYSRHSMRCEDPGCACNEPSIPQPLPSRAGAPLVKCGALHPDYSDVRCEERADHFDAWPVAKIPHGAELPGTGVWLTWGDEAHQVVTAPATELRPRPYVTGAHHAPPGPGTNGDGDLGAAPRMMP